MIEMGVRLGILVLVGFITWLLIWTGQRFVERQRREALAAAPLHTTASPEPTAGPTPVRILAFSSADCHQCHQFQAPALERVLQARGDAVSVVEVDAVSEQQLAQTYHILTVPSTVLLDRMGNARAVNYGFANTQRLLQQVDEILEKAPVRNT